VSLRKDVALAADRLAGTAADRTVSAHHRRRLRRHGWEHAFDAPPGGWAAGEPPPRTGNDLEILVDGTEALSRIVEELRRAESHVHLTGWFFSPGFVLTREPEHVVLRNFLAELAERVDVRVLAWAGAPLPLFRPSRADVRRMRAALCGGSRVRCALDARERPLHCHHEKTIVVDDRVAFVGGIDLTDESGDRLDSSEHPARAQLGWHDATALVRGPAAADVAANFTMRWREVTGETLPEPAAAEPRGDVEVQVVRTIPNSVYGAVPRGDYRILESYVRALRSARRLIYLENQFLWSPEIVSILSEKLRRPPADEFRLLVVLPADPKSGADQSRGQVASLIEADDGNDRFLACTLYARSPAGADQVYVHAKIGLVDDEWLTIGSANLNEHSLFNDTELNLVVRDPSVASATRLRLWSEHLELPAAELEGEPAALVDARWRAIAGEQLERREAGAAPTHRLVALPGLSRRSKRLLGPLKGFLVDG
jgi:phosphatidylserine/phosphatidylglycerophosphate/cardiolipin synthase-like enzyme